MKHSLLVNLLLLGLLLAFPASGRALAPAGDASLAGLSIQLPVAPLRQLKITSCGPAVLTMAYRYANPLAAINERDFLTYAEMRGYYTETKYPYTSPADMVNLLRHYTRAFATGRVENPGQGLALLLGELQKGQPIIIDVTTLLGAPRSGAHFVLVTGLSIAPDNRYAITVRYNDPLTGRNKSAPWYGAGGLWEAWQHNGDPGGSGWWLSISAPPDLLRDGEPRFPPARPAALPF